MINIIHYGGGSGFSVYNGKILYNPCYEVILKGSLDDLMEEIWREHLVDVGARKIICEGLLSTW